MSSEIRPTSFNYAREELNVITIASGNESTTSSYIPDFRTVRQPTIQCLVDGVEEVAMLESGASTSVMSNRLANRRGMFVCSAKPTLD